MHLHAGMASPTTRRAYPVPFLIILSTKALARSPGRIWRFRGGGATSRLQQPAALLVILERTGRLFEFPWRPALATSRSTTDGIPGRGQAEAMEGLRTSAVWPICSTLNRSWRPGLSVTSANGSGRATTGSTAGGVATARERGRLRRPARADRSAANLCHSGYPGRDSNPHEPKLNGF